MDPEIQKLFADYVPPKIKVDREYRLYYNKTTGEPLQYTTNVLQGDFVNITKQEYAESRYDVVVVKEKLVKINSIDQWTKLVPSKDGISTREDNVMIVDHTATMKWKLKTFYSE
jgi:hypothetical protein